MFGLKVVSRVSGGFRVWGVGFKVERFRGLGCRIQGLEVQDFVLVLVCIAIVDRGA